MEKKKRASYKQWKLITTILHSKIVNNSKEVAKVEKREDCIYLSLLGGYSINIKFEEDDFLTISKFNKEGNFVEKLEEDVFWAYLE